MLEGVAAIIREVEAHGTEEDKECLHYILYEEAGSSEKSFQHGLKRDRGPHGEVLSSRRVNDGNGGTRGMLLADFVAHVFAVGGGLEEAHVLALRLYSTAAFRSINNPLRDPERCERGEAHPWPVTVAYLREGVLKLRAVEASAPSAHEEVDLWRGMAHVAVPDEFLQRGGSEQAPMSTTSNLAIAMQYS